MVIYSQTFLNDDFIEKVELSEKSFTQDSSVELKFESQGSKPYSFLNVAISICYNENSEQLNNSKRIPVHRMQ